MVARQEHPANVLNGVLGKEVPSQNRFIHMPQSLKMMYGHMLRLRDGTPQACLWRAVSITIENQSTAYLDDLEENILE